MTASSRSRPTHASWLWVFCLSAWVWLACQPSTPATPDDLNTPPPKSEQSGSASAAADGRAAPAGKSFLWRAS
ncbi:MAG TPA: hypothetical protein VFU02_01530, partial [Polyangiaceae bacterium]|nr:hypothetical protein [Polyangiaceae bacterium]